MHWVKGNNSHNRTKKPAERKQRISGTKSLNRPVQRKKVKKLIVKF